ncbi:MAG: hypothetical protein RIR26_1731 [Pseudomonadota bacterium]
MRQFGKAVFVIGPTASGKTALAHRLAESLEAKGRGAELVNLDAFQFYRGMSIGTAKPTAMEVRRYHYHGLDILEPDESMDAARYAAFVWETCRQIEARGHIPVCVGGSGLYLRAVLYGLDPLPPRNDALRELFRRSAQEWGWPELHRWLAALAPERAAQLHPNDKTRIERALEVVLQLPEGVSPASVFTKSAPLSRQELVGNAFVVQVDVSDELLRQRISLRLAQMFSQGWVQEVLALRVRWGQGLRAVQSMRAIGYPEIWQWLDSLGSASVVASEGSGAAELPLEVSRRCEEELTSRLETLSWQYVRRQRTWNAQERCDWSYRSEALPAEGLSWNDSFVDFMSQ